MSRATTGRSGVLLAVVGLLAALAIAGALAWGWMIRMPGDSFRGAPPPLTPEEVATLPRLEAHVRVLAGDIGERNFLRPAALEAAAAYVQETLRTLGYTVTVQEYTAQGQRFRNLEATLLGGERREEIVVVGGHYDSAVGTPGADDNATGVAAVLELASLLRGERPGRTVRFVAFANEEPPFFLTDGMGSRVYARAAAARGERIVAMLSIETIGYYSTAPNSQRYPPPLNQLYPSRGDFIGFVGNVESGALVRRAMDVFRRHATIPSEGVAAPAWMEGVGWSDHAAFWDEGVPAIMITDTAPFRNPHYHEPTDTPERIDYERTTRVVHGLAHVVRALAQVEGRRSAPPLAGGAALHQ